LSARPQFWDEPQSKVTGVVSTADVERLFLRRSGSFVGVVENGEFDDLSRSPNRPARVAPVEENPVLAFQLNSPGGQSFRGAGNS
jgi:hypothetical protein